MVKIIWTQRSLKDLKSIAEYISQDSIKYASHTIERILDVTLILENNPSVKLNLLCRYYKYFGFWILDFGLFLFLNPQSIIRNPQ